MARRCIIEGCTQQDILSDTRTVRGLCKTHYKRMCRLVDQGETTWEELYELGLALAPKEKLPGKGLLEAARNKRRKKE